MNSPRRGLSLSALKIEVGPKSREFELLLDARSFWDLGNFDDLVHFYLHMRHVHIHFKNPPFFSNFAGTGLELVFV